MRSAKQPWQRCYLHHNHKFIGPAPRTARQAFGHDVEFTSDRSTDKIVFWVCGVLFTLLLVADVLGVWR